MTYFFWYPSIDVFFSLISCNTFTFRLKKKKKKNFSKKLIIRYKLIHTNTSLKNQFSLKQLLEV